MSVVYDVGQYADEGGYSVIVVVHGFSCSARRRTDNRRVQEYSYTGAGLDRTPRPVCISCILCTVWHHGQAEGRLRVEVRARETIRRIREREYTIPISGTGRPSVPSRIASSYKEGGGGGMQKLFV